jgi:hypothetical protein
MKEIGDKITNAGGMPIVKGYKMLLCISLNINRTISV